MIGEEEEEEEGGRLKEKERGAQVGITPASSSTTMLLHYYTTATNQPTIQHIIRQSVPPCGTQEKISGNNIIYRLPWLGRAKCRRNRGPRP